MKHIFGFNDGPHASKPVRRGSLGGEPAPPVNIVENLRGGAKGAEVGLGLAVVAGP